MHKDSADVRVERLHYSREEVQDAVQRLLERGRAYIDAEGYLSLATPSPAPAVAEGDGVAAIAAERRRQVAVEGWTPEHDDRHCDTQLAGAAACYTLNTVAHWAAGPAIQQFWPWDVSWWKPKSLREDLVRAGALIAAEIDRLDRAAIRANGGEG